MNADTQPLVPARPSRLAADRRAGRPRRSPARRAARHAGRILALLAAATLPACSGSGSGPPEGPARRVILITCDTLRADHLGVYGYERPTSPELDAFAEECVVFESCTATSSITGPSLSAIMTGLYPDEIGAFDNGSRMPEQAVTLAELARDAGYATAAVVSNPVLKHYPQLGDVGTHQGFEHYDDRMTVAEENRPHLKERLAPDTATAAIRWLEGQREQGDDAFFLWVHFQDPHGPYTPPAELAAEFDQTYETDVRIPIGEGRGSRWGKNQIPAYQRLGTAEDPVQHPGVYRDRYDAEIRFFDRELGRLLEWLRSSGWLDDSLVVFSADHGEAMGENGYWFSHGETVYRGVVHVPLVVRYPAGVARPAGARESTCVSHLDLWPTVIEALGLEPRPNRGASLLTERVPKGRAFLSTIRGPVDDPHRWEGVTTCNGRMLFPPGKGVRPELYDTTVDPREEDDLMGKSSGPAIGLLQSYKELKASITTWMRPVPIDFRDPELREAIGEEEANEGLEAMQNYGYTEGAGEDDSGEPVDVESTEEP